MSWLDRFRRRPDPSESLAQDSASDAAVRGERSASEVQRPPSLQSRMTNWLAFGLMGVVGLGVMGWYYSKAVSSRGTSRAAAQASTRVRADGEITLRPLGRVDTPLMQSVLGGAPEEPPLQESQGRAAQPNNPAGSVPPTPSVAPTQPVRDPVRERQLSGRSFVTANGASAANAYRTVNSFGAAGGPGATSDIGSMTEGRASSDELEALLEPSAMPAVLAQVLPTLQLLLPKGGFLDCTLETAIDSTLSGMTTCILATDVFSADGSVVLMERGTKLTGETRGQVRQGAARVFVLWLEARTPKGVVVALASPGTDELGRAGLSGQVDRHFAERFGAAILVSTIDGVIQTQLAAQRGNGSTVMVNPTTSQEILTETLRSTINIPPTVFIPQGDRIQVLVARDLDFRSVYTLRPIEH
jgi:type IV secretion system protein VirB10